MPEETLGDDADDMNSSREPLGMKELENQELEIECFETVVPFWLRGVWEGLILCDPGWLDTTEDGEGGQECECDVHTESVD